MARAYVKHVATLEHPEVFKLENLVAFRPTSDKNAPGWQRDDAAEVFKLISVRLDQENLRPALGVQIELEQNVLGPKAINRRVVDVVANGNQAIFTDLFDKRLWVEERFGC